MKSTLFAFGILAVAVFLASCQTAQNRYSQAELNAIETRIIESGFNEAFTAASSALFDAGYTIAMSDREAGLITGERGKDNTASRILISPFIQDTRFVVSIQVAELDERETNARIKTSVNGEPVVDRDAINEIWLLMQRQVMMREPLQRAEPEGGSDES